ncbi:AcrR family transcriptional regulator [Deinobacterium chartae]|uniref:AcrR family transcriptional regulator n=1 Tax=Deinobacterium chartae TaxID=521158 RepID=A0A841HVJ3_9DEIO|nr:TetR/AcrR family transcriptional regulator [Deinobacterium chartae]MBB6096684.1 AcrR family transcriptional regulator [Deinobacterium chartae]
MPNALRRQDRARSDSDKEARRRTIVSTALRVFGSHAYADVTMSTIAREAGLAKGTLYLYFHGKEELFLHVLEEHLAGWLEDVTRRLHAASPRSPEQAAHALLAPLEAHGGLLRLLGLLATALEHNADPQATRAFQRRLNERLRAPGTALEAALPGLEADRGAQVLWDAVALMIGRGLLAGLPGDPASSPRTFQEALEAPLSALLRGMLTAQRRP